MKTFKMISLVVLLIFVFNLIAPDICLASEALEPISISNGTTEYRVNKQNGRFTIHTKDGIPNKPSDNDKNLLFLGKDQLPDTSFTTFRIDGEDYIFGNSYGLMGSEGQIVGETVVDGKLTTTVWKIKDITITQKLFLIVDESNPNIGNTRITYEISNAGTKPVQIGSRILLDTQLGANDASAMVVGTTYVTNETVYQGDNVPVTWKSSEKQFAPDVVSYGILSGFGNVPPNKLAIGHWQNLSNTKWDFTPNEKLNFTTDKNTFGSADSGVAVYFDPRTLENGKDLTFETFYGIGSTSDTYSDVKLGLQLNSPLKLTVNDEGTGYNEQEFEVVVNLDNNIEGGETLKNIEINLGTSEELSLAEGEVATRFIDTLKFGETINVKYRLKASVCQNLKVAQYGITAKYGDSLAEASKYIVLPSIKGIPPKMQMNEISPKILYTKTEKKKVVIKGSDFDSLKADYDWTMFITSKVNNQSYEIKRKDIEIENDTLTINIDKDYSFDANDYDIVLTSQAYGRLSKTITMSNDAKYDRKEYGIMVMGAFDEPLGSNSRERYNVRLFDSEDELEAQDDAFKDKILLRFKGEIYSYTLNGVEYYDCDGGTLINNAIKYTPPVDKPKQAMTIRRYEGVNSGIPRFGTVVDSLVLTGEGKLSIADYNFHSGDFYIKLDDREDYELPPAHDFEDGSDPKDNPNPLEAGGGSPVQIITPANEIITGVFSGLSLFLGLNITVSNAVIGTNTVSLGGSVTMDLPWWAGGGDDDDDDDGDLTDAQKKAKEKFDKNEKIENGFGAGKNDESILKLNMEEMRYGIKDNASFLVGLKADGGINLTDDSIPMLKAGGAKAGFKLDSLDYDGMYAAVNGGFKVGDMFEAEAEVAVIIETSGQSFLDSIEIVVGGKVVKIPLAGLGFLTKMGGGVSGLYDTCKGNFTYLPPIMLKLISGYADPTMYSFQLDTIAAEFGPRGFQFTAEEGKIVGIKLIASAYAKLLMYEYQNQVCVDMGAGISMNFLGILKGDASVWLVYDPRIDGIFGPVSLGGKAFLGVFLPDWLPLIGGMELLSVMAELSTKRVFLGIRIIGIPISVGYYWDSGEVKFFDTFSETVDENGNVIIPSEELANALAVDYQQVNGKEAAMVYGSNLRKTYSSRDMANLFGSEGTLTHTIPVQDQAYGLFELNYQGEIPAITVTQPDGTPYELKNGVNYMTQVIPADKTQSGVEEKKVFISVENPQNGNWKITTDKPVECDAMDVLPLPEVKNVKAELKGDNKIKVDWDALNVDGSYKVDIHASKAQNQQVSLMNEKITEENAQEINAKLAANYDPGIKIAENINASDKTATIDLGDRLLDGEYQIRVVLKKDTDNFASELSENTFTYNNPLTPDKPQNVKVNLGGDGLFKVSYDPVEGADGYYVQVLDENGNPLEGVAPLTTKATETYIGGVFEVPTEFDANNKPIAYKKVGAATGSKYKVSVSAFKEVNAIKYESNSFVSDAMLLPEPNPAKINIQVDGKDTVSGDESNENIRKALTNKTESVITLTSNQDIEMMYKMDGEFPTSDSYMIKANEPFPLNVHLKEGENHLSLYSKNNANDYTTMELIVNVDTVKPELMIDNTTVMSVDGHYEIVGSSENDSEVYINDSLTPIPQPNGVFTYSGVQTSTRDEVKITAVDKAGNENTMYIQVVPSELSAFKNIVVKKQVGDTYTPLTAEEKINKGEEIKVAVFGVDSNNKEYKIDDADIKRSVVAGNGLVTLKEDGTITSNYPGDAVILYEYYPTENYSFEEVVGVSVQDVFQQATDVRISNDEIMSNEQVGTEVARLSVPNSPLGISYDYTIADNDYFEIRNDKLVLKKPADFNTLDITVTAKGKHIIEDAYEEIGEPVTKQFTIKTVKDVVSVETLNPVETFVRQSFDNAPLPKTVQVKLGTGESIDCNVAWQQGAFNKPIASTYTLKGNLELPEGVVNTNALTAAVQLNVSKRKVIFNFDDIPSVEYTGEYQTPEIVVKDGDIELTKDTDYVLTYRDNKTAGRAEVTVTGINDYEGSLGTAYFTITPKPIGITGATIQSKAYDGTRNATVNSLTYEGLVDGDDVEILTSALYDDAAQGQDKQVTVTPTRLSGADCKNYQLAGTPIQAIGTITKADVNVFVSNTSYKYDGGMKGISVSSIPSLPQSDFAVKYYAINGNTVDYSNTVTPVNVGKYLYVIEENNHNYEISNKAVLGDGAAIPTGANVGILEISTSAQNDLYFTETLVNKTYGDGNYKLSAVTAETDNMVTYTSSDESVATVEDDGTVTILKPGTTTITATSKKVGADDRKAAYALVVAKKDVTVTANDAAKVYGDDNPDFSYSLPDDVDLSKINTQGVIYKTNAGKYSSAGSQYTIEAKNLTSDYYNFHYNSGTLTINKREVNVSATVSKEYDGKESDVITNLGFTNVVNGDSVTGSAKVHYKNVNAGNQQAMLSDIIIEIGRENYKLVENPTTEITANIAKAPVTFTGSNSIFFYDGNEKTATVAANSNVTGFPVSNSEFEVWYNSKSELPKNVGTYAVTAKMKESSNYTSSSVAIGTLEIKPSTQAYLVMNGIPNGTISYGDTFELSTVGGSGKGDVTYTSSNKDVAAVDGATGVVTVKGVGKFTITATKATDGNYSEQSASATLTSCKKKINLNALTTVRAYNGTAQAIEVTSNDAGFDVANIEATYNEVEHPANTIPKAAGKYRAEIKVAEDNPHYTSDSVVGYLTIAKAPITIKVEDKTKVYGDANPEFTTTYTLLGEDTDSDISKPVVSCEADEKSPVGEYMITASGEISNNYDVTYESGKLAVTKKDLTITAEDKEKMYSKENPEGTVVYNGFVNNESHAVLTGTPTFTFGNVVDGVITEKAGDHYDITVSGLTSGNYNITFVKGSLKVNPLPVAISGGTSRGSYLTINLSEAVPGITVSDISVTLDGTPVPVKSVEAGEDNRSYTLSGEFTVNSKYNVSINKDNYTFTGAEVIPAKAPSGGGGSSAIYYNIAVKQAEGGKISPTSAKVAKNGNYEFTITPNDGYTIKDVLVDGRSVGAVKTYKFEKVVANAAIEAVFEKVKEEPQEDQDTDTKPKQWENPFADVTEQDWFFNAVKFANENVLMNGASKDKFSPDESTTRAMAVAVLYRLEKEPNSNTSKFVDVKADDYFEKAVAWASENSIVKGTSEIEFTPDENVSREQLVTILYRYANAKGYDTSKKGELNIFTDYTGVSEYAKDAVSWAIGIGLMKGKENNKIDPQGNATRAEIAAILQRFIENIK